MAPLIETCTGRLSEVRSPRSHRVARHLTECALGYTATVFGATGFLGRYIVHKLGRPIAGRSGWS